MRLPLLVCAAWIASLALLPTRHPWSADTLEQLELARCLSSGEWACVQLRHWLPGMALLSAGAGAALGSLEAGARWVAAVCVGLLPLVASWSAGALAALLRRSEAEQRVVGSVAALLCLWSPLLWFFGGMADNRAPFLLVWGLALGVSLRWWEAPLPRRAAWMGLVAGAAILLRSEGRALGAIMLGVLALRGGLTLAVGGAERQGLARRLLLTLTTLLPSGAAFAAALSLTLLPWQLALHRVTGRVGLDPRSWEMHLMGWMDFLPLPMLLDLFGYGQLPTSLRAALQGAVGSGQLGAPSRADLLAGVGEVYLAQAPVIAGQALETVTPALLLLALVGGAALVRRRQLTLLLVVGAFAAPVLALPAARQSVNAGLPPSNLLFLLIPTLPLAALGAAPILERLWTWRRGRALSGGVALGAAALALGSAVLEDQRSGLFEGAVGPRAAGLWIREHVPEQDVVVASWAGSAVTWFAGRQRAPLPSPWEVHTALPAPGPGSTWVVLADPDLHEAPLTVEALVGGERPWCQPRLSLRSAGLDAVFICEIPPAR